jgi:DHA2 family multidrug resistance protein-like MFS transporter
MRGDARPSDERIAMSLPAESLPAGLAVHDGLPNPQRLLAFLALAMATAMAVLDGAIVNVALPTVAHGFAVTPANSVWIVNAFQLAVTVSLLPLAALGDTLGYRAANGPSIPARHAAFRPGP